jgi:hypothetical protein
MKEHLVAQQKKNMNDLEQNQISFLVKSSSILGKLASILESSDPDALSTDFSSDSLVDGDAPYVLSVESSRRRSRDRAGLLKKSFEDSLVLLTEVINFYILYSRNPLPCFLLGSRGISSFPERRPILCVLSTLDLIACR